MDIWHKLTKFLDYERGKVIGLAIALAIGFSIVGCDVTVPNPFEVGGPKVTATELELAAIKIETGLAKELADYKALGVGLEAKVDAYNANLQIGQDAIVKEQELRTKFIQIGGGIASTLLTGGTLGAPAIIASLIGLTAVTVGTGAVVDKRRLNGIIKAST